MVKPIGAALLLATAGTVAADVSGAPAAGVVRAAAGAADAGEAALLWAARSAASQLAARDFSGLVRAVGERRGLTFAPYLCEAGRRIDAHDVAHLAGAASRRRLPYAGADDAELEWRSLYLAFEPSPSGCRLVAITRGEWTI